MNVSEKSEQGVYYIGQMKWIYLSIITSLFLACNSEKNTKNEKGEVSKIETDLHDIWVLEWIKDIYIDTLNFELGLPTLEINPSDSSVLGHTGCNRLNAMIEVGNNNEVKFDRIATTRKFCLVNTEPFLLDYLTRTNQYNRESLMLTFLEDSSPLLKFKKVD